MQGVTSNMSTSKKSLSNKKGPKLAALALACALSIPAGARDPALVDRHGQPRSERAQWVYRIVAKWGGHVQEAYRTQPRQWAESMGPVFANAPLPALRRAAAATGFAAMNDALLAMPVPAAGVKALGDPAQDLVYVPVTPCRILDTRIIGGPIPANSFRDFDLTDVIRYAPQGGDTSNCNVGDKGSFAAAAINFTVVNPSIDGYITAFPYLSSMPVAATLNYKAGDIRNGLSITRLDQSAATNEFSVYSFAQTHLVADIVGYFAAPKSTALECINLSSPLTNVAGGSAAGAFSPNCPVGYIATSGFCRNSGSVIYLIGSVTSDTSHYCEYFNNFSPTRAFVAHVRCCRVPGQ